MNKPMTILYATATILMAIGVGGNESNYWYSFNIVASAMFVWVIGYIIHEKG